MTSVLLIISLLAQMNPFGCGQTARIAAKPNPGYRFVEWSDGVKEAERSVELSSDSTLTARFEKETSTAVGALPLEPTPVRAARKELKDGRIIILRDDKIYTITGQQIQ